MNMTRVRVGTLPEEADDIRRKRSGRKGGGYGKSGKGGTISERRAPSVVLFQVCIRFVFQSIMFARGSLTISADAIQRSTLRCPKRDQAEQKRKESASKVKGKIKGEGRDEGSFTDIYLES